MLDISTTVTKGVLFIRLEGDLDNKTFINLSKEINYLLYSQGIHYFVFNFEEIEKLDNSIFNKLQNKLTEIFLSCGKVVLCGLNDLHLKKTAKASDRLFYVKEEQEAFKYFSI